ncbi:MAG: hypothetical protein E7612_06700 [Ruminococcaceae bacterium]|nr:hypothetical protein [Oscillospiraceae bacterium]
MANQEYKDIRKPWFRFVKKIMRLFIKETEFVYLSKKIDEPTIILSNHVGTAAPLAWELYGKLPFRFWGASEMNSGLVSLYKYQTRVFYHEKKHWNLHLARLFCIIASPLTNMFYKGINLISTYHDIHFTKTISESIRTLEDGKSVIIFPEISDKGYLDVLEGFHQGFTVLGSILTKKGKDFPITVAYYRKNEKRYIVDKPIMVSELFDGKLSREEIAKKLCDRCNELGQMDLDKTADTESEHKLAVNH